MSTSEHNSEICVTAVHVQDLSGFLSSYILCVLRAFTAHMLNGA